MTDQLLDEDLIPLGVAANQFPGARGADRVNPATVYRWCTKGTRAPDGRVVKLEWIRAGNRMLTTRQAVARYVAALSSSPEVNLPIRGPAGRTRASEAASAALAAAGA